MRQISSETILDVEALTRAFIQRKITKPIFRVPISLTQAQDLITAGYKAEVTYRHRSFVLDEETRQHIMVAAKWLIGESRSGLLLCGNYGNGKTTLLRALRSVIALMTSDESPSEQRHLRLVTALDLARMSSDENLSSWQNLRNTPLLAIDDVGADASEVMKYGNTQKPVVEIICHRYEAQLPTLLSTNLAPPELRNHYGDRVADRMKEVMEKIIFTQPSYRAQ